MENLDPEHQSEAGRLDNKKKIQVKNLSLRNKLPVQKRDNQSLVGESNDSANNSKANRDNPVVGYSASTSSFGSSSDVSLTEKNDSLCDFRSPVKNNEMNESLADFKVKPTVLKLNKRVAKKESKSVLNKKRRNQDTSSIANQPSIESSFFKPQTTVKTGFLCPLCCKTHKDATARHNHMKSCAAKNKIPTDKVLDAVELQKKQANERKALGLLAAPVIQPKKTMSRKLISEKDPQLQLALALSMSLHEAQVSEEIEDAHLLAGEPCLPMNSEMSEERRKTLQNFGFTTNKLVTASTSGKSRKKRPAGPTALQIRTQEERDRLLTVRIAEVLMGDEAITQALLENVEKVIKSEENVTLKSRLLRSYHCVKDRLWDKTQQCLSGQGPYSCNLLELSQSEVKSEPEIEEPEQGTSKLETLNQNGYNPADIVAGNSKSTPINVEITSESSIIKNNKATVVKYSTDENSAMDLSEDWRCMLHRSYMSDVVIVTKERYQIHAHQVVFWVRCKEILNDMTPQEPESLWKIQQRILWPEIGSLSAEAFLEYVYCGVIKRSVTIFDAPDMLAEVRILARKYRLKKLFAYLKDKSNELKSEKIETSENKTNLEANIFKDSSSSLSENEGSIFSLETDINSVSTVCNEGTSNKPVIDERSSDCDNVGRETFKSMNVQEKKNVSHDLVVDCFSSSNDSFAIQSPTTSSHTETTHEKLSGREMTERTSTNVATTGSSTTDIRSLEKSSLYPSRTDLRAENIKSMNGTFEEDRCTSPDLFDDSTTSNSACVYTVPKDRRCDSECDKNCSDADIEVVSTSNRNMQIRSPDLKEKCDETADVLRECRKVKMPEEEFPFVSTRRKGRSFKPLSTDVDNLNLQFGDSGQETKASGSLLKKKGDITMAIEKFQRLNAKTASESDSDCEPVEIFPIKKHKNPFRINVTHTSSMIEEIIKDELHPGADNEIPTKRRNKLSIFEKKIELEAAKNPAMFNLNNYKPVSDVYPEKKESTGSLKPRGSSSGSETVKLYQQQNEVEIEDRIEPSQKKSLKPDDTTDAIFDLTQESSRESIVDNDKEDSCDTNTEDKDLSMFTKYKRKHSHNSIDKYRAALEKITSRTSVRNIKDTEEAFSSDDLLSSNDELWDTSNKMKPNSIESKYEYTDQDQSTSNEPVNNPPESLSSTDSDDRGQSAVELDDVELSDLEIDLSDFSKTSNQLDNCRADRKSQGATMPNRKSGSRTFNDQRGRDSLTDTKLEDTEFTIMKNDCGMSKTNVSDQDTDTECFIESISPLTQPKIVDESKGHRAADGDKSSEIYNEEIDTEEMEDKHYQPRYSRSKMKLDTTLDVVFQESVQSQSLDKDCCEISSPEYEISGIISPPSTNFDFVPNITNEVENLLDECKASSKIYRKSQMNLDDCNSQATTSLALVSTPRKPRDDLNNINLLNEISDSEFDDMEFIENQNSSKSGGVAKGVTTMSQKLDDKYYVLESDSSDNGSSKIQRTKSSPSIFLANRSKAIRKRSIKSRRDSITQEMGSKSSHRSLNVKSVSENIIKTKSKIRANFMDDSFDQELARVQTPPIQEQNTSSYNDQTTPYQAAPSRNVTPLANYSAMKTPELTKELEKYGLKPQKRHRAKQLLRHIYDELHPLVPVGDKSIVSHFNESSSEDERPPPKRINKSNSFDAISSRKSRDNIESDCETLASDNRISSDASNDNEGLENDNIYTLSQSNNSEGLETTFRRLVEVDRSLHNKILAYEPLMLEELHATLKAQGLKCKLNALMDFLDEQCITFRTLGNAKNKGRTRRKASPKKNQGGPMR